ncbi:MAG TPA: guanylate kinase [Ruminococcaceae bacterium]|nr:guanylate kinase [Oscillospiraceae bacterium]
MAEKKGKLVVFSAPSGCGKDTILQEIFHNKNCEDIVLSKSMTTRAPRSGEQNGVDYYFVTREEFEKKIAEDGLIEFAEYSGNYYGTPKAPVEEWMAQGKTVILEIEVQGASKVVRNYPDALSIFILPPSLEELERRLRLRNTDSEETIARRIAIAPTEIAKSEEFKYCVVNDDLTCASEEVYNIITK